MITRIEIDGFKTFRNLVADLAPFQTVVGPAGVGKSNLFDALGLLSNLAEGDLRAAFQEARGEPAELFSLLPDGSRVSTMRMAVEMLTEPTVLDDWGAKADVKYTRMRYEIEIARIGDERRADRFRVVHEALLPVQRSTDPWARRYIGRGRETWLPTLRTGRTVPFISSSGEHGIATVFLHQDGRGGDMAAVAHGAERTVLSTISNTEFPHAFAAREEMRGWSAFELDPRAIRNSGQSLSHSFIGSDGGNLAAALLRMKGENPEVLGRVVADLTPAVPGLAALDVDERGPWGEPHVTVRMHDGAFGSLPLLSGAALRLLAIAALNNDPDAGGLFCLEEPENGLDPHALRHVVPLLHSMCTDLEHSDERGKRLRQVLVATHSVEFVRHLVGLLGAGKEGPVLELPEILFAHTSFEEVSGGSAPATRFGRVTPSPQLTLGFGVEEESPRYTLAEVEQSLGCVPEQVR